MHDLKSGCPQIARTVQGAYTIVPGTVAWPTKKVLRQHDLPTATITCLEDTRFLLATCMFICNMQQRKNLLLD